MSSAYDHMRAFHLAFDVKLIKAFPFNSNALQLLSFLDPEKVLSIPLRNVQELCDKFAVTCGNDAVVMEFREFLSDPAAMPCDADTDAIQYWLRIQSYKSCTGVQLYGNLASAALQLLAIPVSNADSERVFSLVRRIQTDFRASLNTSTLSSLIGCHFNKTSTCCEYTRYPDVLLQKAVLHHRSHPSCSQQLGMNLNPSLSV